MKQPGKKLREAKTRGAASTRKAPRDLGLPRQEESPSLEHIARRAYELYCERGQHEGYDVEDWLRAEHEVSGSRT